MNNNDVDVKKNIDVVNDPSDPIQINLEQMINRQSTHTHMIMQNMIAAIVDAEGTVVGYPESDLEIYTNPTYGVVKFMVKVDKIDGNREWWESSSVKLYPLHNNQVLVYLPNES